MLIVNKEFLVYLFMPEPPKKTLLYNTGMTEGKKKYFAWMLISYYLATLHIGAVLSQKQEVHITMLVCTYIAEFKITTFK